MTWTSWSKDCPPKNRGPDREKAQRMTTTTTTITSPSPRVRAALSVNGVPHEVLIPPSRSLADTLRYDLGLTGTKRACNEGECGSCSVLLDGELVNSCLVPAVEADGHEVTTIEGLATAGRLDPVQQAFADNFASQCGYCTPGMIMTAKALLARNHHPSEAEIRDGIRGNLCRCTGYAKIVQAISAAAGATVTSQDRPGAHATVGRSVRRIDADEKVTGKAAYAHDMALPGMVYGEILRSPLAHARITRIDTARVRELPGVLAVLTQADMPSTHFGAFTLDETALADGVVRYVGEGVAAVIAADEETAQAALELIDVDYEPLPAVVDPEAAMAEGAPQLHEGAERNIVANNRVVGGDIEQGLAEADVIYEDRFETSRQCHVCLEPHAVIA